MGIIEITLGVTFGILIARAIIFVLKWLILSKMFGGM